MAGKAQTLSVIEAPSKPPMSGGAAGVLGSSPMAGRAGTVRVPSGSRPTMEFTVQSSVSF